MEEPQPRVEVNLFPVVGDFSDRLLELSKVLPVTKVRTTFNVQHDDRTSDNYLPIPGAYQSQEDC